MEMEFEYSYKAIVFDEQEVSAAHGDVISIASDSHVEVVDRVQDQREELSELIYDCPRELLSEPTRWVYYPWRHSVVRVLGESSFVRLRTDRNRNKITATEQKKLQSKSIAVVGLSVGHAIAFNLAQERLCGQLRLVDYDELSLSNLNRIPADVLDISLPKAVVLARRIAEMDPYFKLDIVTQGLEADNMASVFEGMDLVIDECDSIDMKFALRFEAKKRRIPVVMQTSDNGVLDVERFDIEPKRVPFHGLARVENIRELADLSNAEKVPLVMDILEADKLSSRLAASMIEIEEQISTWPQLASDINFGAGLVGVAIKRWGLGRELSSGRLRLDLDEQMANLGEPDIHPEVVVADDRQSSRAPVSFAQSVLAAASRAPSGGNMQPWRFSIDEREFSVYLDPRRSSLMDIKLRGSLLAIGAALYNGEITAAAAGKSGVVKYLPNAALNQAQRDGREAVARIQFGAGNRIHDAALQPWIERRACARKRGKSTAVNREWAAATIQHAKDCGARAVFLQNDKLTAASELWSEADRIRFLTPKLHREMFSELVFPGGDLKSGIDVRTLELAEKDMAALAVARRADAMHELASWNGGKRLGEASQKLLLDADALLVLTAPGNSDCDYVSSGRLLQKIWLEATRAKVGLHPISPVFMYATSPSDLIGRVSPDHAKTLWQLRSDLAKLCDFSPEQPIALTLRVTSVIGASVRSRRESVNDRLSQTTDQAKTELA